MFEDVVLNNHYDRATGRLRSVHDRLDVTLAGLTYRDCQTLHKN